MKTSAELQQQAFFRKLIYFGLIVALFTVMTFSGSFARSLRGAPTSTFSVTDQATRLQLSEHNLGQASVLGATARTSLTGSRGFAICILWISAIEKQKRHEWNDLEMLVNVITKLQPHFLTPWLFQSWNLSYNVSVESDRVKDKYFYISKGIELLAEGERLNRARGVDANGQEYYVGHPDMRYWIGFYYQNKFGLSDEQNALRSLLQMSCINPAERHATRFRGQNRRVPEDSAEFKQFVKQHPMLCRRLRDFLRCARPDDVVDYSQDNWKLPTRYQEVDGAWVLKSKVEDQFPVLPDSALTNSKVNPRDELTDEKDNFYFTWAWATFAQEPMPPYEFGKPSAGVPPYDHLRYRLNRQPMAIIFRQAPHRALTYIAERLQKEGWFDASGWVVDEGKLTDRWFPNETLVAGDSPRYSAQEIWKLAYNEWTRHGQEHGLSLEQNKIDNLNEVAKRFRSEFGRDRGMPAQDINPDQLPPDLRESWDAHQQLIYLQQNLHVTNFAHFRYQAQAEQDGRLVEARKLMFDAERLRRHGNPEQAIRKFQAAFDRLCGNRAEGRKALLEEYPNFRTDPSTMDDLYEQNVVFLRLMENQYGQGLRGRMTATQLVGFFARSGVGMDWTGLYAATLYQATKRPRELPALFQSPLDGVDSKGQSWFPTYVGRAVKEREGYIKPAQATGLPEGAGMQGMQPPQTNQITP